MYFPILIGVENGRFNSWKIADILVKYVNFESQFSRWRSPSCQLSVSYSHYFTKMPCFLVVNSWHTYVLCHPNRDWKWTFHYLKNWWHSSEKCLFWILISKVKGGSMGNFCFTFLLFKVNGLLFSSKLVAYEFIFPS